MATVTIRSPRGGKAVINPQRKYIIHYKPSDAYYEMRRALNRGAYVAPITKASLHDSTVFRRSYSQQIAIPVLINAMFHPVRIPYQGRLALKQILNEQVRYRAGNNIN